MEASLARDGFTSPLKVEDALSKFIDAFKPPKPKLERIPVEESLGRVLGQDVTAKVALPSFDRAIVDGYAIRSEDVQNASQLNPAVLKLMGENRIGKVSKLRVTSGTAVAVATGSIVPEGADAVVMVERTTRFSDWQVQIETPVEEGQGISKRGDDVSPGTPLLRRGSRLRPQDIGILKALGQKAVQVVKKPRIAILSTGDELTDRLAKDPAKVVDVNRPIISSMVCELGAEPVDLGIAMDREEEIFRKMKTGLKSSDALMVSAGSSVGKRDLVPKCINRLGKPGMLVHGVAMRPSLPTGLAVVNGKPVFSLPGFPVSAMFAFRVFARPIIARMMGAKPPAESVVRATLKQGISGARGLRTFVRVNVKRTEEGLVAEPLRLQRAAVLTSMVAANGIVAIPEEVGSYNEGQQVDVTLIGEIGE